MRSGLGVALLFSACLLGTPRTQFREHVLAADLRSGYQVIALDVDRDGDQDLVALASGMSELVWYENPKWERHVLSTGRRAMINLAACSEDEEGFPVFVFAEAFSNRAARSLGTVFTLKRQSDPREQWKATEIDRLPTSHRARCADFEGNGEQVFVNAPLTGEAAEGPDYREPIPLVYYRAGVWKRELIGDDNQGVMHGIHVFDWDGDGRDEILTASFSGIHVYDHAPNGIWSRTEIAGGDPSPWPKSGASDLVVGHVDKTRFVASIEPWHGNQVAVYTQQGGAWKRNVIEDSMVNGHTVGTADLDGDGRDEIIAGYRGEGRSVYIFYSQDAGGLDWVRTTLDNGGIAAASCAVADLIGDLRPDIACIGSATANLKLYENLGPEQAK